MKKTVKTIIFALLIAAVIASVFWGSGIIFAMVRPGEAVIPQAVQIEPAEQAAVGNDVKIDFDITLPENRSIISAALEAPAGTVAAMPLGFKRKKWQWNRSIWHFSALIRALSPGEIPEGKVKLLLSPKKRGGKNEAVDIAIPQFSAIIPASEKPGGTLELSAAMPGIRPGYAKLRTHLARYKYIYMISALVLIALAIILIRKLKNTRREIEMSCWEAALAALDALHSEIRHGEILPMAGYNALMDILRNYLELRFELPASRQTTAEFIPELLRTDSPLPEKYRGLLSTFLNSVDLIRFAKAPADLEKLDDAVRQLCGLVSATVPAESLQTQKGAAR